MNLFSGVDLDGNTVGIANVGAMCGRFSRGVTQDRGRSVANTGAIAAHEMGHIFNMRHDDPPSKLDNVITKLNLLLQY